MLRQISPNDRMFDGRNPDAYFSVGASALACIRLAMDAGGKPTVERILDFPCGHGRVLRAIQATFPNAHLTACDIDRDGVDFCVATFGAEGVYSSEDLDSVPLDGGFDLIWVGSLLTHLPLHRWGPFVSFLTERLAPDGLLLFTTHGPWCANQIRNGESRLGGPRILGELMHGYEQDGFGFSAYAGSDAYGVSLASPQAVTRLLSSFDELRLVLYLERGWARHQDVVACERGYRSPAAPATRLA